MFGTTFAVSAESNKTLIDQEFHTKFAEIVMYAG